MNCVNVRIKYEFAEGLSTTLHCSRPAHIKHQAYTCKPKTINVSSTYEFAEGLSTTLKYPQKIVLKHHVLNEKPVQIKDDVQVIEIGPSYYL
jgi:hypothetical protein